eukprot:Tbor_TRINITY_DN2737_c0_g1::TRINITY_DN2737_c0_g1_i1::g.15253::m.15253
MTSTATFSIKLIFFIVLLIVPVHGSNDSHPIETWLVTAANATINTTATLKGYPPAWHVPNVTFNYYRTIQDSKEGDILLATGVFENSLNITGWDQVRVLGDPVALDGSTNEVTWMAAGAAEGYSSFPAIQANIEQTPYISQYMKYPKTNAMIESHYNYMWDMSTVKSHSDDNTISPTEQKFWNQLRRQLLLLVGLVEGYNARAKSINDNNKVNLEYNNKNIIEPINFSLIFMMSFGDEWSDFNNSANMPPVNSYENDNLPEYTMIPRENQKCSGLVKITDNDLFVSHVTWAGWNPFFTARQYKTYIMISKKGDGEAVSMTTNAGIISSGDDYYITSPANLTVIETTNDFSNNALYRKISPKTVSTFMRTMIATFLAQSGEEWTNLFGIQHSGTYANQWMVVNNNIPTKVNPKTGVYPSGLFFVLEEIPGLLRKKDMSEHLIKEGYWGSYNIPYFPEIYKESGFDVLYEQFGTFFSWSEAPRAKIFRKLHSKVTDMKAMEHIMRYNEYETDPDSLIPNCTGCKPAYSPMLGIASRGDLVQDNVSWGDMPKNYSTYFAKSAFGGADAKISSRSLFEGFKSRIIQGPTTQDQVPFTWSTFPKQEEIIQKSNDTVQTFNNFRFFDISGKTIVSPPSHHESKDDKIKYIVIGSVSAGILVIVLVTVAIRTFMFRGRDRSDYIGVQ